MTKKMKALFLQAALILPVFALVIALVLIPKQMALSKALRDSRAAGDRAVLEEAAIMSAREAGDQLKNVQDQLIKYRQMAPAYAELPQVLDNIASGAQTDALKVISLQALDEKKTGPKESVFTDRGREIRPVVISMEVRGPFRSVGRYLTRLENAPYKIMIQSLILENRNTEGKSAFKEPVLSVRMKLAVLMSF